MSSLGTCSDPQCVECGLHEYQDEYTTEPRCKRQPYCDPSKTRQHHPAPVTTSRNPCSLFVPLSDKNMKVSHPESRKKQSTCSCLPGFHCSSVTCVTCVPHTTCKPGQWAKAIGKTSWYNSWRHPCDWVRTVSGVCLLIYLRTQRQKRLWRDKFLFTSSSPSSRYLHSFCFCIRIMRNSRESPNSQMCFLQRDESLLLLGFQGTRPRTRCVRAAPEAPSPSAPRGTVCVRSGQSE